MKIYFDGIIYSWQKGGGVRRYFDEIINKCLQNKNISITLLLQEPNYIVPFENLNITKFKCFLKWSDKSFSHIRKIFSLLNKIRLNRYFKSIDSGIFHSTYYTTFRALRIPQIVTVHDMTHEKFPNFFNSSGAKRFISQKKKSIDESDAIICVSEATRKSLLDFYKINPSKISVIYHGISEDFKKDKGLISAKNTSQRPYFLFVGNRDLYKNFTFLIKTFSKWSHNKTYDIILTGKDLSASERNQIDTLGLKSQIKNVGFVSEYELSTLYSNSKAFIFPSLDEGFGLPILEAISCHTNVLASDIPVFREIGEEMVNYFNPKSEASLIDALDTISTEIQDTETLQKRSDYVRSKFSWEKCTEETIKIYKNLHEKTH